MVKKVEEIPVYIINGFLEAGKTCFITDTVTADYFAFDKLTVILSCEQGETPYPEDVFKENNTVIENVTKEQLFDKKYLSKRIDELKAGRVIIEFNGMWANDLPLSFPENWLMNQQITIIDASTFSMYFMNNDLKSLFINMIRDSEMIIFNRCVNNDALKDYLRSIKAVNSAVQVLFEDMEGYPINVRLDEDLPYDINSDSIVLNDESYGIWFIDMMDRADKYEGKEITFKSAVLKPPAVEKGMFVSGRKAMTCCANDIQFLGYICKYDRSNELKNGDWVDVTVTVKLEYFKGYKGVGPVLYAKSVQKTKPPKDELIYFGNS